MTKRNEEPTAIAEADEEHGFNRYDWWRTGSICSNAFERWHTMYNEDGWRKRVAVLDSVLPPKVNSSMGGNYPSIAFVSQGPMKPRPGRDYTLVKTRTVRAFLAIGRSQEVVFKERLSICGV